MIIKDWEKKGVNFINHLYVPEQHPVTGEVFCEMKDERHVFKACSTTVYVYYHYVTNSTAYWHMFKARLTFWCATGEIC